MLLLSGKKCHCQFTLQNVLKTTFNAIIKYQKIGRKVVYIEYLQVNFL